MTCTRTELLHTSRSFIGTFPPRSTEVVSYPRDTAKAYADYTGYVGQLSHRVQHFMTVNEFDSFTNLGYSNT